MDFGLAKKYRSGKVKSLSEEKKLTGTARYASIYAKCSGFFIREI